MFLYFTSVSLHGNVSARYNVRYITVCTLIKFRYDTCQPMLRKIYTNQLPNKTKYIYELLIEIENNLLKRGNEV